MQTFKVGEFAIHFMILKIYIMISLEKYKTSVKANVLNVKWKKVHKM